jgi:osmotically-inducible protein OsmY
VRSGTITRGGRIARRGAKGWVAWRGALPARRSGHPTKTPIAAFLLGAAVGFALSKFDKRRRHTAVDRAAAAARDVKDEAVRKADYATDKAKGAAHAATEPLRGEREYDDVTLARKVESELFRPPDAPKGSVSVSVANGVVELRGRVTDSDQVEALEEAAKKIDGVKDVRNLLSARA